jgi:hypothetical protein
MDGTVDRHTWSLRFPPREVAAGDYVVAHLKTFTGEAAINEVNNKGESGGADSSAAAWDFWLPGEEAALPGGNGLVCLYRDPSGGLLDAMIYSERTSTSDTAYGGFGSKNFQAQAAELAATGQWKTDGETIRPEDCVPSAACTSTRTLCRGSSSADTDAAADWHTVPTGKSSFGQPNSDERYDPTAAKASKSATAKKQRPTTAKLTKAASAKSKSAQSGRKKATVPPADSAIEKGEAK